MHFIFRERSCCYEQQAAVHKKVNYRNINMQLLAVLETHRLFTMVVI